MGPGKAVVIGGSLSGLFAGLLLRSLGWHVQVYEKSKYVLESRGGGLLLHPEVLDLFSRAGLHPADIPVSVTRQRISLDRDGHPALIVPLSERFTTWNALHRRLRAALPDSAWFPGFTLTAVEQEADSVVAHFDNGHEARADLLVAADGGTSTVRQLLFNTVSTTYSGLVAWRGVAAVEDVAPRATAVLQHRQFYFEQDDAYFCGYPVPADGGPEGYNWIWYRTADEAYELPRLLTDRLGKRHPLHIAPGGVDPQVERALRHDAKEKLCWPLQALVSASSPPFLHAVVDVSVGRMVQGRVALVGEAAFVSRPLLATGTARAATNVMTLGDALATSQGVAAALRVWEPPQLALGGWHVEDSRVQWNARAGAWGV
jgi:2-polyprenyl-6-methoxyphenol hydroxylase-like FAD-dependent oxidoreductase